MSSAPTLESGQHSRAASVLDRQAADGRWAVAPAVEQERAFARAPTRELAILAPCFLRELVFGAGKRSYRVGLVCLDSCLLSHASHKTAANKLPYRRRMPCWRVSAPSFAASAMCNAALAPSEEDTLAPGRSVRRFLNSEGAPGLSGVRGGGENVEIQTSFVAESLETMAGLSGMLNDGESSKIMSGFAAESLHAAAAWRCTRWR